MLTFKCLRKISPAALLVILVVFPSFVTPQVMRFVYDGPDGCSDEECDCVENVDVQDEYEDKQTEIVHSLSCKKANPAEYLQIPPSALSMISKVKNEIKNCTMEVAVNGYHNVRRFVSGLWENSWLFCKTLTSSIASKLGNAYDYIKSVSKEVWTFATGLVERVFTGLEMASEWVFEFLFRKRKS